MGVPKSLFITNGYHTTPKPLPSREEEFIPENLVNIFAKRHASPGLKVSRLTTLLLKITTLLFLAPQAPEVASLSLCLSMKNLSSDGAIRVLISITMMIMA